MSTPTLANLEKLLYGPRDSASLRYSLGIECLKAHQVQRAIQFFEDALIKDATYFAAWKSLATARRTSGDLNGALAAYLQGIEIAQKNGDLQAVEEMKNVVSQLGQTLKMQNVLKYLS